MLTPAKRSLPALAGGVEQESEGVAGAEVLGEEGADGTEVGAAMVVGADGATVGAAAPGTHCE